MNEPNVAGSRISTIESIVLASAVITSATVVCSVIRHAGFGYDFSDEGYYLNFIATPWMNQPSITQFGFVYHPLYRLVGGDIALLRRASILLTMGLGWILCLVLLKRVLSEPANVGWRLNLPLASMAAVLSTATLASLHTWMPPPNYNSLTLQALLIAGTGILLADASAARQSTIGWTLIGISGWLAFMAKPTSAMALGGIVYLYLLLSGKMNLRMLGLAVATAGVLGLISAWLIGGSVAGFIEGLAISVEDTRLLQGRHTLGEAIRLDDIALSQAEKRRLGVATLFVFLSTCFSLSSQPAKRLIGLICAFLFSAGLLVTLFGGILDLPPSQFQGLQYWAVPIGVLLAALVMTRQDTFRGASRNHWALVIFFAVLPWVYAFGTNSNYWAAESKAAIFWVLSGIALLCSVHPGRISWRMLLPAAAAAQVCTGLVILVSMEYPYRQTQPLRLQQNIMHIEGTGSELLVSREFAEYVDKLQQLATTGGFRVEMPMLDLSGHYPGSLYALGARSLGRSWLIGGYPGSDALAVANLDRVPREELAKAWILTEPTGPRKLSPEILRRYGIDLMNDYIEVGSLDSPTGSYPESYRQHLWRPAR